MTLPSQQLPLVQVLQHRWLGTRFQISRSLPILSITADNHPINRVAAHTNTPFLLTLHQPPLQTLILKLTTILRSVPITVSKAPVQMRYRSLRSPLSRPGT